MKSSVIVLTTHHREENLRYCLKSLTQQTVPHFEVLVMDDGSESSEAVISEFAEELEIQHHWREHDYCMSRSYNLGVAASQSEHLIFLSSDIILNPHALGYYHVYFENMPKYLIFSYFGNVRDQQEPSVFFPDRQVNLKDDRFRFDLEKNCRYPKDLIKYPQTYAWGGNWAVSKSLFQELGGFDEQFQGWGLEDVEFANRAVGAGIDLTFAMDTWGEHQVHELDIQMDDYHRNREAVGAFHPSLYVPGLLYNARDNELPTLLGLEDIPPSSAVPTAPSHDGPPRELSEPSSD